MDAPAESRCVDCGTTQFVARVYGERGGPMMCVKCGGRHLAKMKERRLESRRVLDSMLGGLNGPSYADEHELTLELLLDAIALTHPDKHPPERLEHAQRVTSDLLALRPFVKKAKPKEPKPKPPAARTGVLIVTDKELEPGVTDTKPSRPDYPCAECRTTYFRYYCDECRKIYDAKEQAQRDKEAEQRRKLRARKRRSWWAVCQRCAKGFQPNRRDARYCSKACKQAAFRLRVTA